MDEHQTPCYLPPFSSPAATLLACKRLLTLLIVCAEHQEVGHMCAIAKDVNTAQRLVTVRGSEKW